MIEAGLDITGAEKLTGLAEYRNGGLFLDSGLIELRDPKLIELQHKPSSELVIEWRALTIQLLDQMGELIQNKLGKTVDATTTMDKAIHHSSANPIQIHGYGRQLIAQGKTDKAMEIFTYNYEQFKGAWPTEVGMMRGLSAIGKYEKALKHAKTALTQAPDKLNKDGLTNNIEKLKLKQDVN